MPRFYFHFRDGGTLDIDDMGIDYDSFESAYLGAFAAAVDMWHERLIEQRDPRDCAFEIANASGRVLSTLSFVEVLDACRSERSSKAKVPAKHGTVAQALCRNRRLRQEMDVQVKLVRASLQATRALLGGIAEST